MPNAMYTSYKGGIEKWGTICGSMIAPINLIGGVVADDKIRAAMVNELLAWYTQYPFPEYQPVGSNLVKIAVGSPLCHVSCTTWCNKQGVTAGSKEKKQRCAGLSADVVKKTIEMLDAYAATGTFAVVHKPDPIVATCMGCHEEEPPCTEGKDNCLRCHGSTLKNMEEDPHHKSFL